MLGAVLTEAQAGGAGVPAAALAAGDAAALDSRRGGGRHRDPRDPPVAAVAQQLPRGAGATAGCGRETRTGVTQHPGAEGEE